jgi:glycosyltransferase involved in cell wall biosynthesis
MRLGQNPAKAIDHVAKPARVTVAVVSYIPFLGGYYSQSLDVLKACLESIWRNTDQPYDLLVFDNASCVEVRTYLTAQQQEGRIQFLVLSEKNIGKGGAWNVIFAGAPGEIIAYADSDIYFLPGWLPAQLKVLETFPNAGMITGMPMWSPAEYSTSTVRWADNQPEARLERGKLLAWEDYWRHARSLGQSEAEAQSHFDAQVDICLFYQGQRYYIGAGHFQFVARRDVLQRALPIPSERPMGQVRSLDKALNRPVTCAFHLGLVDPFRTERQGRWEGTWRIVKLETRAPLAALDAQQDL